MMAGCSKENQKAEAPRPNDVSTETYQQQPLEEYLVGTWVMDRTVNVVIAASNMVGTAGTDMAPYFAAVPDSGHYYTVPAGNIPEQQLDSICFSDMTITDDLVVTMPLNRVFSIDGCPDYLTLNASVVCDKVVSLTTDTVVYEIETDTWAV